ncbi:MAG: SMP-30/gluconolactonase/LRE family protein, partial [Xanthomonadales bacterium]|nr:SMP-30/gluconolactonase/LRE family protein [Xanthomonadales bacterium]
MRRRAMPLPGFRIQRRNLLRLGLGAAALAAAPFSAPASAVITRRAEHRTLACNLQFPEGPVALDDGSVLIVEIAKQVLTRVDADGHVERLAQLPGGPNGAAIGPDGACYVCNNGGDRFAQVDGVLLPVGPADEYAGGWIERVDLRSGQVESLYETVGGRRLSAPNDLVFDGTGANYPHIRDALVENYSKFFRFPAAPGFSLGRFG